MLDEETEYKLLKMLQEAPQSSQCNIARAMGISLGKTNYCLRTLVEKGRIKARNFYRNPNKRGYAYLLTLNGLERKTHVTAPFSGANKTNTKALSRRFPGSRTRPGYKHQTPRHAQTRRNTHEDG